MNELLQRIAQNPLVTLLSLALGVIGIILALVFYLKSRKLKVARYEVLSRTIVEDLTAKLDGLEVRYQQVPQQRITVSRVFVWNEGTDTIDTADLTPIDPLRVEFSEGAELLDARIVFQTYPANQVRINVPALPSESKTPTNLNISFDYLDHSDGAIVQLVHTGARSHKIVVKGKIKGSEPIQRVTSPAYRAFPKPVRELAASKVFGWFGVILYFAGGITSLVYFIGHRTNWYLLPVAALGFFGAWVMFIGYTREQLPRSLRKHVD